MTVARKLGHAWVWSGLSAAVSFVTTIVTIRLAGAEPFAAFFVDLAKISLIAVLVELLPTSYFAIKLQDDTNRVGALVYGYGALGVLCLGIVGIFFGLGLFERSSVWMYLYTVVLPLHRLALVQLQSTGRTHQMFQFTAGTAIVRFAALFIGLTLGLAAESDVIWFAITLGHLMAVAVWMLLPDIRKTVASTNWRTAPTVILSDRAAYGEYYLNSALKRVRDTTVPILAGAFVSDATALARYFLVIRGVDFVLGQLRVVEHFSMNLTNRAAFRPNRITKVVLLSFVGGIISFCSSLVLGAQSGFDSGLVLLAAVAATLVFPASLEFVWRADAYLDLRPRRVTISLLAFLASIAVGFSSMAFFEVRTEMALVLILLFGAVSSTASFAVSRRGSTTPSDG